MIWYVYLFIFFFCYCKIYLVIFFAVVFSIIFSSPARHTPTSDTTIPEGIVNTLIVIRDVMNHTKIETTTSQSWYVSKHHKPCARNTTGAIISSLRGIIIYPSCFVYWEGKGRVSDHPSIVSNLWFTHIFKLYDLILHDALETLNSKYHCCIPESTPTRDVLCLAGILVSEERKGTWLKYIGKCHLMDKMLTHMNEFFM